MVKFDNVKKFKKLEASLEAKIKYHIVQHDSN